MSRWIALLILSAAVSAATVEKPKLPPDLERIVQLANASPPEFAADGLLRVAGVSKIDKQLRMDLIDRAFHTAAGAQFHTPMIILTQTPDTSAGMVASAARLNLDTLTLQTRAVRSMLLLNSAAARQLFLEISQPAIDPPGCDQLMVPDLTPLYETLSTIANSTFSDQERKKEEHINLVMGYMSRAASPTQIAPLERMVASLSVSPEQRDILMARLNGLRQSLVTPNCRDKKPTDISSRPDAFWKSDQAKRLFTMGVHLRFKDAGSLYTDAERDTPEWYLKLTDFMKELADWQASDEKDEASFFHQKAIIYEMLVELTPRGAERDKLIQSYVDFVANSELQREKPVEWYFHAQSLLTRVRSENGGEPAKIAAAFVNSGNPVLALYMDLDKVVPTGAMSPR